jgi:hypothetical protein
MNADMHSQADQQRPTGRRDLHLTAEARARPNLTICGASDRARSIRCANGVNVLIGGEQHNSTAARSSSASAVSIRRRC